MYYSKNNNNQKSTHGVQTSPRPHLKFLSRDYSILRVPFPIGGLFGFAFMTLSF